MSEGLVHSTLVSRIVEQFKLEFGADIDVLLVDLPGARSWDKPPRVGRFTPDVWAVSRRRILLGEAKTAADLDTAHTLAQLESFLKHVSASPIGSRLTLAVPTFMVPRARLTLSRLESNLQLCNSLWSVLGAEAIAI
jgi:hypothetical protein